MHNIAISFTLKEQVNKIEFSKATFIHPQYLKKICEIWWKKILFISVISVFSDFAFLKPL